MGGFTVWKLHTDVLTGPSKICCALISNQSRLSTKTDYVDKRDPFERQADPPITLSKITTIQWERSGGGTSGRGLGARYHGGSVRERQPLKIAERWSVLRSFWIFFSLNGLNECSNHQQNGDEEEDQFRAEEQNSSGGESFNYLFFTETRNDVSSQPVYPAR